MSILRSIRESALIQSKEVQSRIELIASLLPENEQYQLRKRLNETVQNLQENVAEGFAKTNKIERVRSFVSIVGKLMESKDYIEYIHKSFNYDTNEINHSIDELSNLLLVNSGTLN